MDYDFKNIATMTKFQWLTNYKENKYLLFVHIINAKSHTLIHVTDSSQFMDSYSQNDSSLNQHTNLSLSNITCKEDFIEINDTCLPRCDRFELISHSGAQLRIYTVLIVSCLALLICILIVILSIKYYKTM